MEGNLLSCGVNLDFLAFGCNGIKIDVGIGAPQLMHQAVLPDRDTCDHMFGFVFCDDLADLIVGVLCEVDLHLGVVTFGYVEQML